MPANLDILRDQLLLIRIDGMHSHRCEETIRRALLRNRGVHEVEVDFPSGQASVLFDGSLSSQVQLVQSVAATGYIIAGATALDANADSPACSK